jgi:hypothetical protein
MNEKKKKEIYFKLTKRKVEEHFQKFDLDDYYLSTID